MFIIRYTTFCNNEKPQDEQIYRNETTYELDNNGKSAKEYGDEIDRRISEINNSLKKMKILFLIKQCKYM